MFLTPHVDDGGHAYTDIVKIKRGAIRRVVVGKNRSLRTWNHRVTLDIGANRTSEHHTGTIIVGEYERSLVGTCGENNTTRQNTPYPRSTLRT